MPTSTTDTLAYYDENAAGFASSTADVEFSEMQQRFEALLSPGARILDFGCGSGRDAKHFLDAGFDVTATDGSAELCKLAEQRIGRPVRHELFQELSDIEAYDGIWACSSILHLPKAELADVFGKMLAALKPGGVIYTSFKHGTFEGMRNGRYFTDFTEATFRAFIAGIPGMRIKRVWITGDARPGRQDEQWLNLLLTRSNDETPRRKGTTMNLEGLSP